MRIGTISFNINAPDFNYGAMLHSWAFQKHLQSLEFVDYTEIIDYARPHQAGWNRKYPFWGYFRMLQASELIYSILYYGTYRKRLAKFDRFIKEQLAVSEKAYTQDTLKVEKLTYDTVICESDVIWAPERLGLDPTFYLAWDNMKDLKRIAYAPSMADGKFSEQQEREELHRLLQYPQYLSCRESYEAEIIARHTDKPVTHVMDPVLLLDPEQYDGITAEPLLDAPYLLLYMPVNENPRLTAQAKEYAKKHGLKLLEISTKLKPGKDPEIVTLTDAGIEEFLSAVRNADMIFTNSFHAICFAILFKKQFYAFTRKYQKKVKDICNTFDLNLYYMTDDSFAEQPLIDYCRTEPILRKKRRESADWLTAALLDNKEKTK